MKKYFFRGCFCLLLFSSITSVQAENNPAEQALDDYGKVTGGWYLNERCSFLTYVESELFDNSFKHITETLSNDLGGSEILFKIQASAKKLAQSEKFSACGADAKEIVELTSKHANNWSKQINLLEAKSQ